MSMPNVRPLMPYWAKAFQSNAAKSVASGMRLSFRPLFGAGDQIFAELELPDRFAGVVLLDLAIFRGVNDDAAGHQLHRRVAVFVEGPFHAGRADEIANAD